MGKNSNNYPRGLRTLDCDFAPRIETTTIPAGSEIRVKQQVYHLEDGSVRDLYIATLSQRPDGSFEITTLVGEDEVLIEWAIPATRWRRGTSGNKCGRRS